MSGLIERSTSRAYILNFPVDLINLEEAVSFTENCIKSGIGGHVVTLNPEMISQASKNPDLNEAISQADLVIPDGVGIAIALKKLGIKIKQLPGIEYSEELIRICAEKGYTLGFLGASGAVVENAVKELQLKYPDMKVVFINDGYFIPDQEPEIIEKLKKSSPQVLFVALGVPKQELWISRYKKILDYTIMVGVGGSFDVWAKKIRRAPVLFRKFGLEWFYRLISQPQRFNRMFPTLPLFFIKVLFDNKYTRKE